jgi:uncharacterized protein (TIGR02246 family)
MRNIKVILFNLIIPNDILTSYPGTVSKKKFDNISNNMGFCQFFEILNLISGIITICIISTLSPTEVKAQEAIDSAGFKKLVFNYQNVWNTHNPAGVANFFTEEADMVFGNLPAAKGRKEIEASWQNYFNRLENERRGWFDITFIKVLSPVTAIIDILSTTGIAGDTSTFRKARGTWLVYLNENNWLISAMRGLPTTEGHVDLIASMETTVLLRPQIRAFVADYENAFNEHKSKELSQFYRADADILIREQPKIHGIHAIEEWWRTYFSQPRPYRALFIIDEIRLISEDVALLNIIATGVGLEITEHLVPARQARGTWILLREDRKWLISALRVLPSEYDRVIR